MEVEVECSELDRDRPIALDNQRVGWDGYRPGVAVRLPRMRDYCTARTRTHPTRAWRHCARRARRACMPCRAQARERASRRMRTDATHAERTPPLPHLRRATERRPPLFRALARARWRRGAPCDPLHRVG